MTIPNQRSCWMMFCCPMALPGWAPWDPQSCPLPPHVRTQEQLPAQCRGATCGGTNAAGMSSWPTNKKRCPSSVVATGELLDAGLQSHCALCSLSPRCYCAEAPGQTWVPAQQPHGNTAALPPGCCSGHWARGALNHGGSHRQRSGSRGSCLCAMWGVGGASQGAPDQAPPLRAAGLCVLVPLQALPRLLGPERRGLWSHCIFLICCWTRSTAAALLPEAQLGYGRVVLAQLPPSPSAQLSLHTPRMEIQHYFSGSTVWIVTATFH